MFSLLLCRLAQSVRCSFHVCAASGELVLACFFQKSKDDKDACLALAVPKLRLKPGRPVPGWVPVLPGLRPLAVSGAGPQMRFLWGRGAPAGISCSLCWKREGASPTFLCLRPSQGDPTRALTAVTEATSQTCVVGLSHLVSLPLLSSLLFPSLPSWRMPQGKLSCHPGSLNTP